MALIFKRLALLTSIAAAFAADKDARFTVGPAASYAHQASAGVTIGAQPYDTEELAKTAFGKVHPFKYGVLPVLVVIQNDSAKAIRTGSLKVDFIAADRSRVEATPAAEVRFLSGPRKPKVAIGPTGPKVTKSKNPLNDWTIEGRAFSAKMIPPGQSASGFFYFQTGLYEPGSSLYLTGLSEADSGKELFYFEIPLKR